MADNFKYDVFLSHNSKDKPRVRKLAEKLKAAGLNVWFDEWIIGAGDIIALKVDEGLELSRVLLLCISPTALASDWVALERTTAIHRDPSNVGRRFVPLLLSDCELPDTIKRYKYIDFRRESKTAFAELLAICGADVSPIAPTIQPKTKDIPTIKKDKSPILETSPIAELERSITGEIRWINCLAFSLDGTWFASGSNDKTVSIWDWETGKCLATLKGHTDDVDSLVIAPDNNTIFSGSADCTIRRWERKSAKEVAVLKGHLHSVKCLAITSDGKGLISCSANEGPPTFRLWDIATNKEILKVKDNTAKVINTIASISKSKILTGGADCNLKVWDLDTGECLLILKGHTDSVKSVMVTPDKRFAVSASSDKTIKIWDLKTGTCIGTLEGHQNQIFSIDISPNGTLIASAGFSDHTVRLWDLKSGVCVEVIKLETLQSPTSVVFSPDGLRIVVGTTESLINIYRLKLDQQIISPEKTHRYINAKVVLLGEGTVGKTSLAHRLIDDEYVIKDRTHGMNVFRLDLPLPADATSDREALLWDLAGQEDYRLIHQLFLEQTALALLLINPQNDDPFSDAGAWLKALKTATNNAEATSDTARLLLFSQVDAGGMKLGKAKIERFKEQYGFAGWLATSAKTGENCSDKLNKGQPSELKQLIAGSIPWDNLPWTSTPRILSELKNAVMAMRDQSDVRLLRFSELAQRLEQTLTGEKFSESDLRTSVTLLANHGLVRPLKFGDMVLLRPDLINGYAAAVIRAARAHTDEIGSVLETGIYQPDFDFTGVDRLKNRPDEELMLRALVQTFLDHSLCIAEDTPHGRHLVFPSQYRREKDTPKNPDIFVSYTFSGEWQTIWTTLVVRLWYSQEFGHRELWRNAAEFETSKNQTLGMLIKKEGDGIAKISLYFDIEVPDELKVIFIEYVHRHLARYACDVERDRRYQCPACGKPVTDLNAVRERKQANKDFITCQGCDEKVPFIDFIEQRLKSDPVAKKILAMDETATRQLDTQALEQILIGHMMAIAGEANQIFRPVTMFDHGIDGEVEFKDNDGNASGKKIYIQLKSGNSYLRTRKGDGKEVFDLKNDRHLEYWINQPVEVYLVIRQVDEMSNDEVIRWMNVTKYLKDRQDKNSRQIIFKGDKLTAQEIWKVRDRFFSPALTRAK